MAQTTPQAGMPLIDDVTVKNSFADSCAGVNFINGNVHITLASVITDHTRDPARSDRLVSARIVTPIVGAIELRDLLSRMIDALISQGIITPTPSSPTIVSQPGNSDNQGDSLRYDLLSEGA